MNDARNIPVEVTVLDFARNTLSEARVTLVSSENGPASEVPLTFDSRRRVFQGQLQQGGAFRLKVEASGFEGQERDVQVDPPGLKDMVILGKPGMPFYYKRHIKVPFEPMDDLLAVLVAPYLTPDQEPGLTRSARRLGLSPIEVSSEILANHVRLYRFTKSATRQAMQSAIQRIERNALVRRAGPVVHRDERSLSFLTNELVVRFNQKITREDVQTIASELKLEMIREIPHVQNGFILRVTNVAGYQVLDIGASLISRGLVEYAEPNLVVTAVRDHTPNDTDYSEQPHHPLIESEAAWDREMGDHNILIAVMDDGCDTDHQDLTNAPGTSWNKVVNPFNFTAYNTSPTDTPHGTRSCGIATAVADNALGVAGVAPGCQLMPLESPGGAPLSDWSDAYIWIAGGDPRRPAPFPTPLAKGADVISNSFGVPDFPMSGIMKDTWDYLTCYGRNGRGCVVVFAASNENTDMATDVYCQWANYEKTVAVAACTISPPDAVEQKVSTSNFGDEIDICAPAGGPASGAETRTMSTGASNTYGTHGQTSCACPQVAGVAALVLSANPDLTWVEVRQLLRDTAIHIDAANVDPDGIWRDINGTASNAAGYLGARHSRFYGYGRVNSRAAVQGALDLVGRDPLAHIDTWIRENTADVGNVPCPPPFSPDVWVRNLAPTADAPAHAAENQAVLRGQDNWVYVNVRNRGVVPSRDVYARIMVTRWAGTQYVYPADFLPTAMPSTTTTVMAPGTYLIGEVHIDSVPAGGMVTVNARWPHELIPPQTITVGGVTYSWADSCLLVEISPHDGPAATGHNTWDDNNLCQRNVTILNAPMAGADTFAVVFVVGHWLNTAQVLNLRIERQNLPAGVELQIDYINQETTQDVQRYLKKVVAHPLQRGELTVRTKAPDAFRGANTRKAATVRVPTLRNPEGSVERKRVQYNLSPEGRGANFVFTLPTARNAYLPVVRTKDDYQIVALRGRGLNALKRGDYQVNICQEDLAGRMQGAINLVIRRG